MFSAMIQPSRLLRLWIVGVSLLAGSAIWFSALPWWLCCAIDFGVMIWFYLMWQRHHWNDTRVISFRGDGWFLNLGSEEIRAVLEKEYYLSQWLIVLHFRSLDNQQHTVVILPDSLDANSFRQLRVLLKQLPSAEVLT